jgi:hypothetical protein
MSRTSSPYRPLRALGSIARCSHPRSRSVAPTTSCSRLRVLAIVMVGALAVSACGKQDKIEQALSEMASLEKKMCACKTKECAEQVEAEHTAASKRIKESLTDEQKRSITSDQKTRMKTLESGYDECKRSRMSGGAAMSGGSAKRLSRFLGLKDRMCACKDADCVSRVSEEWRSEMSAVETELSEQDVLQIGAFMKEFDACMTAALKLPT